MKLTPTQRTIEALQKLRAKYTFREIVDLLAKRGHRTSISHLSRILSDGREASGDLADTVERVAK